MSVRRDGHPRWKGGAQCGQAIVELALVLPVLLLLTMGVLGVGRITQAHMAVRAVAWEAARAAALAPTSTAAAEQGLAAGLAGLGCSTRPTVTSRPSRSATARARASA